MRRVIVGTTAMLAVAVFSFVSYADLPARVPIHWGIDFQPDGYAPRAVGAIVLPIVFLLTPLLAAGLIRIDPRRRSHERHGETYWFVINATMLLLAGAQLLIVGSGLGWDIRAAQVIPFALGAFFVAVGNRITRLRPNWWMGIRTPWTLSDDDVWRRTHRLGARAMVAGGVVLAVSAFLPDVAARALQIAALATVVGVPVVASYVFWRGRGRPERPVTQ